MRIAILIPSLANKGPIIVAKGLIHYFVENGCNCHVYYFDEIKELDFPCKCTRIGFFENVDFSQYDILHVHCLRPMLYAYYHRFCIKKSNVKVIATLHQPITKKAFVIGGYNPLLATLIAFVNRIVYNSTDCNVVLSGIQYQLAKAILKNRIEIINNGRNISCAEIQNIENKRLIEELSKKYKILGSASVITKRKGLDQVVNALINLKDFAFVCVGDGPELQALKSLAIKNNVEDRCLWLGYQSDATNYYQYFDLFVMTTHSEGFPLALIEASGNRIASVLSNIEILRQIVPSDCAVFYELDNIASLSTAIVEAYDHKDDLSNKIYEHYKNNLTADIMAKRYLELFENIKKE